MPKQEQVDGSVSLGILGNNADQSEPFVLLGQTGGSRLEAKTIGFLSHQPLIGTALLVLRTATSLSEADITDGKIVIDTSNSDGFLSTIFSKQKLESDFQVAATWTPKEGLRFKGSAGIEIAIPVNRSLGRIDFQQVVYLGLQIDNDGIPWKSPHLSVPRLDQWLQPSIAWASNKIQPPPEGGGNLGPIDFDMGFKFPSGIGLSVNAGGITGGGFLKIEPPNYAGVLELSFQERIELTAYGLSQPNCRMANQAFLSSSRSWPSFNRFNSVWVSRSQAWAD